MAKEEVTLRNKCEKWKVFEKGGAVHVKHTKRMTASQALKHFKAIGVIDIN